jgi:hypothetical protein
VIFRLWFYIGGRRARELFNASLHFAALVDQDGKFLVRRGSDR